MLAGAITFAILAVASIVFSLSDSLDWAQSIAWFLIAGACAVISGTLTVVWCLQRILGA
jgi:hypothetical protein